MKQFHLLVIGVLVLAFVLRVWGANFGLGFEILHPDEAIYAPYIKQTFPFERTAVFDSLEARGDYPSLFFYLYSLAFWLASKFSEAFPQAIPVGWSLDHWFLLWGRVFSALLSTITVFLTIKIGKSLFNRRVGLLSGLFLAVTFVDVQMAHYVKHGVLVQLLGLLVIWNLLALLKKGTLGNLVLAGILFLMAVRVKTIGFFLVFPLLVGFLPLLWRRLRAKRNIRALVAVGGFLIVVGLAAFFPRSGSRLLGWGELTALVGHRLRLLLGPFREGTHVAFSNLDGLPNYLWWPLYLATSGLFLPQFLASAVGFFIFLKEKLPAKYLVLSLVIPCYLVLSLQRFRADRWIILVTPYLAIFAALFWERLRVLIRRSFSWGVSSRILVPLAGLVFLGVSLLRSAAFSFLISQKDTRQEAYEWLAETYSPDTPLFMIGETNLIGNSLKEDGYYRVVNLFPLYEDEIFHFPGDLMVIGSGTYHAVANYRRVDPNPRIWDNYQRIVERGKLVREFSRPLFWSGFFSPFFLEVSATVNSYHQPTIQIYQLPLLEEYLVGLADPFVHYPQYMESDFNFLSLSPGGRLYVSGDSPGEIRGPRRILPAGDYRFDYWVSGVACDNLELKPTLYVETFTGEKEFARQDFYCEGLRGLSQFGLNLSLDQTSPVNFILKLPAGVSLSIEKSVLTPIELGIKLPSSNNEGL